VNVRSSIIAGNAASIGPDLSGAFTSQGHNLVGKSNSSFGFAGGTNGDIVGTLSAPIDPKLSPPGFYGGPTQTQLPLCGSPAIDAGDDTVTGAPFNLTTDQRGAARKVGAHVDIGAVELQKTQINSNDSGAGSLRQLIIDAQDSAVIDLDCSAATVTLTSDELLINKNLTINGPGPSLLTVQRSAALGTAAFRIFEVTSGKTFNLSGVTVSNGKASNQNALPLSGNGGGILNNSGATLNVTNITFSNNSTSGNNNSGGGIFSNGTLTVTSSTFSNNSAVGGVGGGIFNTGTLSITNSTVNNNSANDGGISNIGTLNIASSTISNNSGEGISNNGTLTITNSTISGNSADCCGGGILHFLGTLTITGSTISNNSASGNGGGIYINGGTVTITGSTISNNTADFDGGIFNGGRLSIINSTVNGNTVTGNTFGGGGIDNIGFGTLSITNSTVSNNSAAGVGGILNRGTLTVTSSTVNGNSGGGGILNNGGTASVRSSIVAGNTASSSGPDFLGPFTSQGHNLVGASDGTNGFTNGTNNDIVGTLSKPVDPQLAPLGNYGGPTQTSLPRPNSPAIDAGDDAVTGAPLNLTTDQRGFQRPVGAHVDIGAVEVNYAVSAKAGGGQTATINTAFVTQLQVTVFESFNPMSGIPVTFTAPSSGASGTFQTTGTNTVTVNTDSNGNATAPVFTANSSAGGPYNVVTSLGTGSPSSNFSLTNAKGSQMITFGSLSNRTFGDADFAVSATGGASGNPVTFAASGQCTVTGTTVHITGAGSCTVTASQAGNSNFNAAADVQQSFSIAKASTATALSSSSNPSASGQGVTFTATVSSSAGTPTGTVAFKDNGSTISTCANVSLSSGQAACATSALSLGSHTITADYSGDANFNASSGALSASQVVAVDLFNFSQTTYTVNERDGSITITVKRTGDTTQAASVDYATDDGSTPSVAVPCSAVTGMALERCDYTRAAGTLSFAAGDTQKTFVVLVNDDSYAEGTETTTLRLSNPVGAMLAQQSSATLQITDDAQQTANPVDDPSFFVRQHYHDFLNREPDASGLQFWTNQMANCSNPPPADLTVCRVNVSAAFFLSIEFQQTGFLVERMYKAAYGDATGNSTLGGAHQLPVPEVRFAEFLRDTREVENTPAQVIVGQGNWQQQLDANKNAFALEFVGRQRFTTAFPASMTADAFVNQLNTNAGGVLTSADVSQLDAVFGGASSSSNDPAKRAQVLRQVAENQVLQQREFDRAFVLMQYYGYLRRNPDDAPDHDYTGYDFWLSKLDQFGGDYNAAEMVKAFISSTEYRQRFGQ
jgi:hypothetical protein